MHISVDASISRTAELHIDDARDRRRAACGSLIFPQLVSDTLEEFRKHGKARYRKS